MPYKDPLTQKAADRVESRRRWIRKLISAGELQRVANLADGLAQAEAEFAKVRVEGLARLREAEAAELGVSVDALDAAKAARSVERNRAAARAYAKRRRAAEKAARAALKAQTPDQVPDLDTGPDDWDDWDDAPF